MEIIFLSQAVHIIELIFTSGGLLKPQLLAADVFILLLFFHSFQGFIFTYSVT